jgi:hypothetical protein
MAKNAKPQILMLMANYEERLENTIEAVKDMSDADEQFTLGSISNLQMVLKDLTGLYQSLS